MVKYYRDICLLTMVFGIRLERFFHFLIVRFLCDNVKIRLEPVGHITEIDPRKQPAGKADSLDLIDNEYVHRIHFNTLKRKPISSQTAFQLPVIMQ